MQYKPINNYLVMPKHLNAANCLFGGQMLAWMDEAAGTYAMHVMHTTRIVTARFSEVNFCSPGLQGDSIKVSCNTVKTGTSSLTVGILVQAVSAVSDSTPRLVGEATAVFVSLDELGRPTPWNKIQG